MANTIITDWKKIDWSNVPDAGGMTGQVWNGGNINQPKPKDPQALLKAQEEINKAQAKQINQMQQKSFFEEHKNHLLLVAGLVAGYLLYKKLKK
jgi:predicted DsbA family dithiol-disulfide isomerase